jgi:hypothetical protein
MMLESEIIPVQLVYPDKHISTGEFVIWEFDLNNPNWIRLGLCFNNQEIIVNNPDYFHAMQEIRLQLETDGIFLNCYGASKNVYPSPMSIDMGGGHKAYRLVLGEHGKTNGLVSIFASGEDVMLSTVAEQEQFYQDWHG